MSLAGRAIDGIRSFSRAVDRRRRPYRSAERIRRLVFDGASPFEFVMFRPVFEQLRADPRVEVFVTASQHPGRPLELYRAFGVPDDRILSRARAWLRRFDVHVSAQYFRHRSFRDARTVQMFHGIGGKAWNVSERARDYDRLLLVSDYDRDRFVSSGILGRDSSALEVVGMPKVDCLVDGSLDRARCLERLGLPPERPSILYAPTWQTTSSLYEMGRGLLQVLSEGPWSLLVKLHDNCYRPERTDGTDWARELARYDARPNVRILRSPDICPLLVAADVLVTDLSSVGLEYLLLNRPVIVADAPRLFERFARDEVSHWQRGIGPSLRDPRTAPDLVRAALERPDAGAVERRALARKLFHDPGRATDRAVASLRGLLGLDASAKASA